MPGADTAKVAVGCVVCCTSIAWIFMMTACVLPDWSKGSTAVIAPFDTVFSLERRIGLWAYCVQIVSGGDYECASINDNACDNGYLASARAFTILSVCFLTASCCAAGAAVMIPSTVPLPTTSPHAPCSPRHLLAHAFTPCPPPPCPLSLCCPFHRLTLTLTPLIFVALCSRFYHLTPDRTRVLPPPSPSLPSLLPPSPLLCILPPSPLRWHDLM